MEPEAPPTIPIAPLQSAIERLLTDYHQTQVVVEHATLLTDPARRNRLWRCHLQAAESNVPATIIVKQVKPEGYSPDNPASWDTSRFFRDWAGAQFLSAFARDEGHGPVFYGGNIELGCILLEDMGEPTSLVEPLLKGDATTASAALLAFALRLGRMHAASYGKETLYREIQRQISPEWAALDSSNSGVAVEEQAKEIAEFAALCAPLGVEVGEAVQRELEAVFLQLAEPGPFKTFIHGDPCPDNIFYHAPNLRLIDFEFSGFGHALRDGLYGRLPFPTCWCANTVSATVVRQMETLYRAELSLACPEANDEVRFEQEACAVAASWAFNSVRWDLESAIKQEEQWGIAGTRERLLSRLTVFLDTAQNVQQLPALCAAFAKLLNQLRNLWPEATPLPLYPAFRAELTA